MPALRPFALALLASFTACTGYRPAHFMPRPPVLDAQDDGPTAVPRGNWVPESVYLSEIYLHRPLRETIDLSVQADAADVNSIDEVARSTWFTPRTPEVGAMARGPEGTGPPLPPFTVLSDPALAVGSGGLSIRDSRGQRYEIVLDPPDRPEMRTAAVAIASRLLWAIGYNTPPVYVIAARADDFWRSEGSPVDVTALLQAGPPSKGGYHRLAALAWPAGLPLGYAPESGVRGDDPNDIVPHQNRRTVRALKVFASWLALDGLGPSKTLDRYVGAPGEGHVVHYVVGLDEALGASDVIRSSDPPPAEGGGSPFTRLITLGLYPNRRRPLTQIEFRAMGEFPEDVDPGSFAPPQPYEPADRLLGPDAYWAAKRILALSTTHLAQAVAAGSVSDPRAQHALERVLEARRLKVAEYWFERVTPLELMSVVRTKLTLRDEAVYHGLALPNVTDYRVTFVTSRGDRLDGFTVHPHGSVFEFSIPEHALGSGGDYLVIGITARRAGRLLPRAFEVHLRLGLPAPTVVGIRH